MNNKNFNEFDNYFQIFNKAREKEKSGFIDEALSLYMDILNKYTPEGSLYYERPAIILEKKRRFKESLKVCDLAIKNQQENNLHFPKEDFEHRKNRLLKK